MYNEKLKNKFIEECVKTKASKQRAKHMFDVSSRFEQDWGADICTIVAEGLSDALEAMTGARLGTQTADMTILRKYARWCLDNNIPGACEGLLKSQDVSLNKLRYAMVSGPRQLQERLDHAFPPENDCRPDNLCRGYFWLAFSGFEESDAVELKTEHVDLKNLVIRFSGRVYPIYAEAVPVFRFLCTANSFFYDYIKYEAVIERAHGDKLLRGTGDNRDPNTGSIRRTVSRRLSAISSASDEKIALRYGGIRLSGIFHRMFEEETLGGKINVRKYMLEYDRAAGNLEEKRAARKELELMTDYQRWKSAFEK